MAAATAPGPADWLGVDMAHQSTSPVRGATDVVARSITPRTLRAVDYLRVSTEEQKRGYGIASQARRNARHIEGKGWTHVGTYKDEGVSGSKEMGERPEFDRLMEDAAQRMFDVVVVEKGDRIGRVGRAFWRWVWAFEDMGIFVAITNRNIDNTTPEGRAQMRREADYAETEWENIRSRTQGGLQEKAESSDAPAIGGPPPYGYRIEGKGQRGSFLVIDEDEAAVIRRAYRLITVERLNVRKTAIRLNTEGVTTRSGKPWTPANLGDRLLSGPVLNGKMIFRGACAKTDAEGNPLWGERVAITLPRILTEEEAATLRRAVSERSKPGGDGTRAFYPLSGRLIGVCGASYTGASRESVKVGDVFYRCKGNMSKVPGGPVCDCSYVPARALEERVWSEVVKLPGDTDRFEELAAQWRGMAPGNQAAQEERIAELDRQIEGMDAAIAAVIVASAKQGQPPGAINAATAALNQELAQLREMRAEAESWLTEMEEADQRARDLKAVAQVARHQLADMEPPDQAEIMSLLDVRVTITGPVPLRTGGTPCAVQAWYRTAGREIPAADLSDEEWNLIAPLLQGDGGAGARRSVNGILHKARTGATWRALSAAYGSASTVQKCFLRWSKNGTWECIDATLSNAARVPPPVRELLPPIRIDGKFDPCAGR